MTTLPPHAREGYAALRTLPENTAEERRLRVEVRRLRDQVEALEIALYGVDRGSIFIDVHRHSRIALDLLMRHPRVMGEQILSAIEAALPSPDGRSAATAEVAIYRLRSALRPRGIEIKSRRYAGYWIEPDGKAAVRRAFGVECGGKAEMRG